MISKTKLEKSITVKLLRIVFGIYFVLVLGITSAQVLFEFYDSKQMISHELKTVELSSISILKNALWALDSPQIESVAKGMLELKIVKGLTISDEKGNNIISKGVVSNHEGLFFHSFLITYQLPKDIAVEPVYLAEVKIFSDNLIVFERIEARLYSFVLSAIIKTTILWLLLFWAFKKYLLTPLGLFEKAARRISLTKAKNQPISLELKDTNELKLIEIAFNEMLETIDQQKQQLINQEKIIVKIMTQKNKELEQIVDTRTRELQISNNKLLTLANTDPLTGLNNRRYFFDLGKKLLTMAHRAKQPLSIIMCDIDHFKTINDTYSHSIGDLVLVEFAQVVSALLRESEVFARIGGEEFAIIAINSNVESTVSLASRIHASIKNIRFDDHNVDIQFTVSMGIATCYADDKTINAALQRADERLYHAKDNGRNRTSF